MLDVAAIIVAAIALVGSVFASIFTYWSTYHLDKRKSIRDAEALLRKYQDPLLLAARDLQSRLFNILFLGVLSYGNGTPQQQDTLYIYTPFLVGQFFAWMHIQRQEGQFMALTGERLQLNRTKDFIKTANQITELLNTGSLQDGSDDGGPRRHRISRWLPGRYRLGSHATDSEQRIAEERNVEERNVDERNVEERNVDGERGRAASFVLWKDQQRAIGEVMSKRRNTSTGELACMDFTEFSERWKNDDPALHTWFRPVDTALRNLVADTYSGRNVDQGLPLCGFCAYNLKKRLLGLQHLLVDLIWLLDDEGLVRAGEASISKGPMERIGGPGEYSCTCVRAGDQT